jgi:hypothetical protein
MGEKLINGIRVRSGGKPRELDQADEFERTLADAFKD